MNASVCSDLRRLGGAAGVLAGSGSVLSTRSPALVCVHRAAVSRSPLSGPGESDRAVPNARRLSTARTESAPAIGPVAHVSGQDQAEMAPPAGLESATR
jgi:hypothetical protein